MILSNNFLLLLIVFILCFPIRASAQEGAEVFTAKNAIYGELGGSSGLYAINYGRIFYQKNKLKLSGSLGFSMVNRSSPQPLLSSYWSPVIPAEFTVFWGKSRHHLELGIGITPYSMRLLHHDLGNPGIPLEKVSWSAEVPLRIGYRYQKPEGGFFFRFGYTPIFSLNIHINESADFFPLWGGISFGKSF